VKDHIIPTCISGECGSTNVTEVVEACENGCSNGECVQPLIECSSNSQCGTDGFLGDNFCEENSVFRNFKRFTCNNPRTPQSNCSSSTNKQLIQECVNGCSEGVCSEEPISFPIINLIAPANNMNTTNPVNFTYTVTDNSAITSCSLIIDSITRLTSNSILNTTNSFEYSPSIGAHNWLVSCTNVFGKTNVSETRTLIVSQSGTCTADNQCGSDFYSDKYCSYGDVYKDYHDFSCASGSCAENITKQLVEECDYGCSLGSCEEDNDNGNDNANNNNEDETFIDESLFNQNLGLSNYSFLEPIELGPKTTDKTDKTNLSFGFCFWLLVLLIAILLVILLVYLILK
jgi:hypothetical protein